MLCVLLVYFCSTLPDVVAQQRLFMEAQMSYASAQQDYYAALVEMERAIGKEIPTGAP
jgi:outer membrane protein TolC